MLSTLYLIRQSTVSPADLQLWSFIEENCIHSIINNGRIILTEAKDTLIYEYGIVRCKQSDLDSFDKSEYRCRYG
ncbi:MAG: hypothetical protein PHY47_17805 [Lachnospiraceae bacterium]|nr:hypothetical protein [Lachnospiraceae bacterium]